MGYDLNDACSLSNKDLEELQNEIESLRAKLADAKRALQPDPLPENPRLGAEKLLTTVSTAGFWQESGHKANDLLCMDNAINHWKSAAYGLAEKLADAEAKLASAEPIGEVTISAVHPCDNGLYRHEFSSTERIPVQAELYTTPQPAPDVQAAVSAAYEAEITRLREVLKNAIWDGVSDTASLATWRIEQALSTPASTSALDEFKADIDAHKGALILSASKCKELEKELSRVKDRQELDDRQIVYLIECAVGDRNSDIKRLLDILVCANSATNNGDGGFYFDVIAELKAKYNL